MIKKFKFIIRIFFIKLTSCKHTKSVISIFNEYIYYFEIKLIVKNLIFHIDSVRKIYKNIFDFIKFSIHLHLKTNNIQTN
jgi:hypothetical protein